MKKIGFTTSFPVEVVFASNNIPIDLNNIFVTGDAKKYVEIAENSGYPGNLRAWIKGMYAVGISSNIDAIVGIVQGDCSNTHSLMSTFEDENIEIIPFSYPYENTDAEFLDKQIFKLEKIFKVDHNSVLQTKKRLDKIRKKLIYLDELTWRENLLTGLENHFWLVNSSDFMGNPEKFENDLDGFLKEAETRKPFQYELKFAYIGVPPILSNLYDYLNEMNANVVFNEVQRQFSMPYLADNITEQYLKFTYPYTVAERLADIIPELEKRKIDAVLSYSQSFCHRQIDQIILKKHIDLPFLIVEADEPSELDERTKLRIESFLDILEY